MIGKDLKRERERTIDAIAPMHYSSYHIGVDFIGNDRYVVSFANLYQSSKVRFGVHGSAWVAWIVDDNRSCLRVYR